MPYPPQNHNPVTLHVRDNYGNQILFVFDVEKLSPENLHVEISTAIEKELDRMKNNGEK